MYHEIFLRILCIELNSPLGLASSFLQNHAQFLSYEYSDSINQFNLFTNPHVWSYQPNLDVLARYRSELLPCNISLRLLCNCHSDLHPPYDSIESHLSAKYEPSHMQFDVHVRVVQRRECAFRGLVPFLSFARIITNIIVCVDIHIDEMSSRREQNV